MDVTGEFSDVNVFDPQIGMISQSRFSINVEQMRIVAEVPDVARELLSRANVEPGFVYQTRARYCEQQQEEEMDDLRARREGGLTTFGGGSVIGGSGSTANAGWNDSDFPADNVDIAGATIATATASQSFFHETEGEFEEGVSAIFEAKKESSNLVLDILGTQQSAATEEDIGAEVAIDLGAPVEEVSGASDIFALEEEDTPTRSGSKRRISDVDISYMDLRAARMRRVEEPTAMQERASSRTSVPATSSVPPAPPPPGELVPPTSVDLP